MNKENEKIKCMRCESETKLRKANFNKEVYCEECLKSLIAKDFLPKAGTIFNIDHHRFVTVVYGSAV